MQEKQGPPLVHFTEMPLTLVAVPVFSCHQRLSQQIVEDPPRIPGGSIPHVAGDAITGRHDTAERRDCVTELGPRAVG